MNDKRSLIRYSQRSSERACMVCRISTLSMNTQSYGSRPPFDRSARGTAASRSERKISKLTKLLMRSRSSPLADNSRKRSSMSKTPAIRPAMPALPFEDHGLNQASTDSAIVFGGVQLPYFSHQPRGNQVFGLKIHYPRRIRRTRTRWRTVRHQSF